MKLTGHHLSTLLNFWVNKGHWYRLRFSIFCAAVILIVLVIQINSIVLADEPKLVKEASAEVKDGGAVLYLEPNEKSKVLGKLSPGYKMKVRYPQKNGFVALYFADFIKETDVAWIPLDQLIISNQVDPHPTKVEPFGTVSTNFDSNRFTVQGGLFRYTPSDLQEVMGGSATPVYGYRFEIEFESMIREMLGGDIRVSQYSLSQSWDGNSRFLIEGYSAIVSLILRPIHRKNFAMEFLVGQGVSLNSISSGVGSQQVQTSNLIAYPIQFEFKAIRRIFWRFDLSIAAGYQMNSWLSAPVIQVQGNGVAGKSNSSVNLNAVFVNAGLGFHF